MRACLLILLCIFCARAAAATTCPASDRATSAASPHTPAKNSADRKAMLAALRAFVKKMSKLDVVFVVTYLKTDCRWAWVETEPRSADGTQHYEPVNALLAWRDGRWIYVESPPEWAICEEDPDCVDTSRYFRKLAARHPGLSPAILPAGVP